MSIKQSNQICTSTKAFSELVDQPVIAAVLSQAAPDFYRRCVESRKQTNRDPGLETSFFNLINRMAYRSIPYSCFAGVSLGEVLKQGQDEIALDKQDAYRVSATNRSTPPRAKSILKHFVLNPTTRFVDHTAHFVAPLTNQQSQYRYSSLSLLPKLVRQLQKEPSDLPTEVLDLLSAHGLIWPVSFIKESIRTKSHLSAMLKAEARPEASIELLKPVSTATLSEKTVQALLKGANALLTLFADPEYGYVGSGDLLHIQQDFLSLYHFKEVPLLDLINPDNSVGQKFIAGMFNEQKARSRLDDILDRLVIENQQEPTRPIRLDLHQIQQIKHSLEIPAEQTTLEPDSISVLASPVKDEHGKQKYFLKFLKGHQTGSHFVRYLSSHPELQARVKEMVKSEIKRFDGIVLAELLHEADKDPVNEVTPQLGMHRACIPVSVLNGCKDVVSIELSDLYVFHSQGRFRLRSKKLNREVLPVITNLHTTRIDSNALYRFLSEIHAQYGFYELSWKWGKSQRPYSPRVEMGNLILVPAIWRLAGRLLQRLKDLRANLKAVKEALLEIGVPLEFEYMAEDSIIRVDVRDERSLASFLIELENADIATIRESFEPWLTHGPEGQFASDLIIPFEKAEPHKISQNEYFFSAVAQRAVKKEKSVFAPGSEWTYLKIYLNPSQYSSFVAHDLSHLSMKLDKANCQWFFLPYRDPEFHVRLRVRSYSQRKIAKFAKNLFDEGKCIRYSVETYEREIERYGGLKGCEIFERLSEMDSRLTVSLQQLFLASDFSHNQFWLMSALCKCLYLINSFGFSLAEIEKIRQSALEGGVPSPQQKAAKAALDRFKSFYLGARAEKSEAFLQIENICAAAIRSQKRSFSRLIDAIESQQVGVTKRSYCGSLIHLSLFRLDLELDQTLERWVVVSACEVLLRGGAKPLKS